MMWRLVKLLVVLALLGAVALVGYAYLADFSPPQAPVTVPVTLNVD
jgi:hypothetical protein